VKPYSGASSLCALFVFCRTSLGRRSRTWSTGPRSSCPSRRNIPGYNWLGMQVCGTHTHTHTHKKMWGNTLVCLCSCVCVCAWMVSNGGLKFVRCSVSRQLELHPGDCFTVTPPQLLHSRCVSSHRELQGGGQRTHLKSKTLLTPISPCPSLEEKLMFVVWVQWGATCCWFWISETLGVKWWSAHRGGHLHIF